MVYANVVKTPFGKIPADDEDAKWIREHKIKAFRAMTTGEQNWMRLFTGIAFQR